MPSSKNPQASASALDSLSQTSAVSGDCRAQARLLALQFISDAGAARNRRKPLLIFGTKASIIGIVLHF
jgi:hypothetical protein